MTSLQRYDNGDIEIFIDQSTGESFCSVSGYARMAGKDKSTISRRLQGVASDSEKFSEILTQSGKQRVALICEELIVEWLPKDNPEMASKLMRLGVRSLMYEIAGISLKSEKAKPDFAESDDIDVLIAESQLTLRALAESRREIKEIREAIAQQHGSLKALSREVAAINQRAVDAEVALKELPPASRPVPPKTSRANLNKLVREYCHRTNIRHNDAWRELYREFKYRYSTDLAIRASNGKSAPLDVAESLDAIDDLYALACEMFRGGEK